MVGLLLASYVLRLVPEELADGRLVGDIEVVSTGERRAVHGLDELLSFCVETYQTEPSSGSGAQTER
jgi:hypothetical protein